MLFYLTAGHSLKGTLTMQLSYWFGLQTSQQNSARRRPGRRLAPRRLYVERLEDRRVLDSGGGYLLLADYVRDRVMRYDAATGAFVDEFVAKNSGGLNQPQFLLFGPHDH